MLVRECARSGFTTLKVAVVALTEKQPSGPVAPTMLAFSKLWTVLVLDKQHLYPSFQATCSHQAVKASQIVQTRSRPVPIC